MEHIVWAIVFVGIIYLIDGPVRRAVRRSLTKGSK
jgi:hypothetical protein